MKADKILLLKRKWDSEMNGFRGVPGGRVIDGELMREGAIRETYEEIGIPIKKEDIINQIIITGKDEDCKKKFLWYYGLCTSWEGKPINNEPHKCSKISWYAIDNLPSDITPCAKRALKWLLEDINYIEFFNQK